MVALRAASWVAVLSTSLACTRVKSAEPDANWPPAFGPSGLDTYGNHRVVVTVSADEANVGAVQVGPLDYRWCAPTNGTTTEYAECASAAVVVPATAQGFGALTPVAHCSRRTQADGALVFSPDAGPGQYYVYTQPFQLYAGYGQGPSVTYYPQGDAVDGCDDVDWWGDVTPAVVAPPGTDARQSTSAFDEFLEEERGATDEELAQFVSGLDADVAIFAKPYSDAMRLLSKPTVPAAWLEQDQAAPTLRLSARPGQFVTGVVALFPPALSFDGVAVEFSTIGPIPAANFSCFNTEGTSPDGTSTAYVQAAAAGMLTPLYLGLDLGADVAAGSYDGTLKVTLTEAAGAGAAHTYDVALSLDIDGLPLADHGDEEAWRGSRLRWLNSDAQIDADAMPPHPFTPLDASAWPTVKLLGKNVTVSATGLLEAASVGGRAVLASPMGLSAASLGRLVPRDERATLVSATALMATWTATAALEDDPTANITVTGNLDMSGHSDFSVTVHSAAATALEVEVELELSEAPYRMGMGMEGGLNDPADPLSWAFQGFPNDFNDDTKLWVGSVDVGLQLQLRGEDAEWAASLQFDNSSALPPPDAWVNGVTRLEGSTITASTGTLDEAGNVSGSDSGSGSGSGSGAFPTLYFSTLLTPVKPLDWSQHWNELRYAQISASGTNYTELAEGGATVVNLHQGNAANPYINYPYHVATIDAMATEAENAHAAGMRFKVYNTMRELSNFAPELPAMLNIREGPSEGAGGGAAWLMEHLDGVVGGHDPAWSTPLSDNFWELDAAVRMRGWSRWNNFYVEGNLRLAEDAGVDGLYWDECAFDRSTAMRTKAAMGSSSLIDLHSDDGQFVRSPANGYMSLFPYVDSLWFGEGFDYGAASPEYWLVEISGLPFGLASDMLRYSGMVSYPFKGMLVGSANRWQLPGDTPTDDFDPRALWALWDDFGIDKAAMHGWWESEAIATGASGYPVATNSTLVKVTTYVQASGGGALVILATFAPEDVSVTLTFDWDALGLDPNGTVLRAPSVVPIQNDPERVFDPTDALPIAGDNGGWLLLLERSEGSRGAF